MAQEFKVYGVPTFSVGKGQVRRIVAAKSAAEAARLLGVRYRYLREYGGEVANQLECGMALKTPGRSYERGINDYHGPYVEVAS